MVTRTQYSLFYGEESTPAFAILSFDSGYSFHLEKSMWNVKAVIENFFDTYYSTFSD